MIRSPCPALFGIVFPIHWLWGVFSDQACIFTGCFCCGLQRVYLNKVSLLAIKHLGGRDSPPRLPGEREGRGHNQLNKKPSGKRRSPAAAMHSPRLLAGIRLRIPLGFRCLVWLGFFLFVCLLAWVEVFLTLKLHVTLPGFPRNPFSPHAGTEKGELGRFTSGSPRPLPILHP